MYFDCEKLRAFIRDKNLPLNKIALEANVDGGNLCRLQAGKHKNVSFTTVARLADYFQVKMELFLTDQEVIKKKPESA